MTNFIDPFGGGSLSPSQVQTGVNLVFWLLCLLLHTKYDLPLLEEEIPILLRIDLDRESCTATAVSGFAVLWTRTSRDRDREMPFCPHLLTDMASGLLVRRP